MKQRITSLFAGGVLSLVLFGVASAGEFEDGQAAFQRGDYAEALRLWRPLAGQGEAKAQYSVGKMYHKGQGAPQDDAQAVTWFRKGR